jgi:hypothetical protein
MPNGTSRHNFSPSFDEDFSFDKSTIKLAAMVKQAALVRPLDLALARRALSLCSLVRRLAVCCLAVRCLATSWLDLQ